MSELSSPLTKIQDKKLLNECRARFELEIKTKPEIDSHKTYYVTGGIFRKTFDDFDWYYSEELGIVVKKPKKELDEGLSD
jgi:hypothetical protein